MSPTLAVCSGCDRSLAGMPRPGAVSQPQTAVARLRSARQRLITLGAQPYLQACDRELAAAAAPPSARNRTRLRRSLTPAEQAVARLVATGHSNRQTAAELYISVKTVKSHLGHIFAKLGIRSRTDLTAPSAPPRPVRTATRVTPRVRP